MPAAYHHTWPTTVPPKLQQTIRQAQAETGSPSRTHGVLPPVFLSKSVIEEVADVSTSSTPGRSGHPAHKEQPGAGGK